MYHAALSSKRSSSPGSSRVWSHNTGYPGAAGIHSEVGSGAHARNQLMQRRTSDIMTKEEDIMKKEMKAMQASRKSLETSMLSYSQKMRDISERRTQVRKSPIQFHPTNRSNGGGKTVSLSILDKVPSDEIKLSKKDSRLHHSPYEEETVSKQESSIRSNKSSEMNNAARKPESRMSIDSGISLESHRDSYRSSDADYGNRLEPISARSDSSQESPSLTEDIDSTTTTTTSPTRRHRGRGRERMRFRDSKTSKLAPVLDEEIIKETEESEQQDATEEEFATPRIVPFPDEFSYNDGDLSSLVLQSIMEGEMLDDPNENRVLGSFGGKRFGKGGFNPNKGKKRTPYVYFRPKATQSPSLTALRQRLFRRFGQKGIYFRYSEEVIEALRSLSNSPDRQKSEKSSPSRSVSSPDKAPRSDSPSKWSQFSFPPRSSPTLYGLDLEELLTSHSLRVGGVSELFFDEEELEEFFVTKDLLKLPQLGSRERSISAASSKGTQRTFVSKLGEVKENDESQLTPAMKRDERQISTEKKNVQFFLPEIFTRANVCTSQPPEY